MEEKSAPNRSFIIIFFSIIGVFLGSIIVLLRHYFSEEKNLEKRITLKD